MLAEKTDFTITRMVRLLEVSHSGYYAWAGKPPSPASPRRVHIEQKVAFSTAIPTRSTAPPGSWPTCARTGRSSPAKPSTTTCAQTSFRRPSRWP